MFLMRTVLETAFFFVTAIIPKVRLFATVCVFIPWPNNSTPCSSGRRVWDLYAIIHVRIQCPTEIAMI